jgi:hypothetical protein
MTLQACSTGTSSGNGKVSGPRSAPVASSSQSIVAHLAGPTNPSTGSGAGRFHSCSLLTQQEVSNFLGSLPVTPSGGTTADGEGSVCEYQERPVTPNDLIVTVYQNMPLGQFNSRSWSFDEGPSNSWDVSGLRVPAFGWSADILGQLGFRTGQETVILQFASNRFIGDITGLRSAVFVLAKEILSTSR